MKTGVLLLALIVLGVSQIGHVGASDASFQVSMRPPLDESDQEILTTTIQILMFVPETADELDKTYHLVRGIGTLQLREGQVWLLTNNHWDEALMEAEVIEIRNSEHQLLAVIKAVVFRAMIRYQDEGSMVLKLTPDLKTKLLPAEGEPDILTTVDDRVEQGVQSGDIVQIAYQQPGDSHQLSVRKARVEAHSHYEGVPVMWLVTLDGLPIIQGDSGGGVWFEGRLVGNLWASVYKTEALTPTSRGIAAIIPAYDARELSYYMIDSALGSIHQMP
jgi:hypothetical protein